MSIDARTRDAIAHALGLATGWDGRLAPGGAGQRWVVQPLTGALLAAEAGPPVRRFVADLFRWTRARWRAVPQWVWGTATTRPWATRALLQTAFVADPPVRGAAERLVLVRDRRLRLFDFRSDRVRCVAREAAGLASIRTELEVRRGTGGPFPPILAHDPDGTWYEERLIRGTTLARTPPWTGSARSELEALQALDEWARPTRRWRDAERYATELSSGVPSSVRSRLVVAAAALQTVALARSHGDCQPGNALRSAADGAITWIDWEYSAVRSEHYDRLTLGLGSRSPRGFERRLRRCSRDIEGGHAALDGLPADPARRRGALAIFLLEDLCWRLLRPGPQDPAVPVLTRAARHL